jgi:hypothetical protein
MVKSPLAVPGETPIILGMGRMPKAVKVILINIFVIILFLGALELFFFITVKYPAVHKILPDVITKISR